MLRLQENANKHDEIASIFFIESRKILIHLGLYQEEGL